MSKKYLVTGASGLLGQYLTPHIAKNGDIVYAICREHSVIFKSPSIIETPCDLTEVSVTNDLLDKTSPDIIIHAAGLTSVDQCEINPRQAFLLNTEIPRKLAAWCHDRHKRYVFISSDHVTSGHKPLFTEDDPVGPVNIYAQTKAKAEQAVMEACPSAQIIRTNFFGRGPQWRLSLTDWLWQKAQASEKIPAFIDSYFSPLSVHYLVRCIQELSNKSESGIFHLGGSERLSKYDFAMKFIRFFNLDPYLVQPSMIADAHLSALRPADMSMSVQKIESILGHSMPTISESFDSIYQDYSSHE